MNALLLAVLLASGYSHSGGLATSSKQGSRYAISATTCRPPYAFVPVYVDSALTVPMANPLYVNANGSWTFYTKRPEVRMVFWVPYEKSIIIDCVLKEKK